MRLPSSSGAGQPPVRVGWLRMQERRRICGRRVRTARPMRVSPASISFGIHPRATPNPPRCLECAAHALSGRPRRYCRVGNCNNYATWELHPDFWCTCPAGFSGFDCGTIDDAALCPEGNVYDNGFVDMDHPWDLTCTVLPRRVWREAVVNCMPPTQGQRCVVKWICDTEGAWVADSSYRDDGVCLHAGPTNGGVGVALPTHAHRDGVPAARNRWQCGNFVPDQPAQQAGPAVGLATRKGACGLHARALSGDVRQGGGHHGLRPTSMHVRSLTMPFSPCPSVAALDRHFLTQVQGLARLAPPQCCLPRARGGA